MKKNEQHHHNKIPKLELDDFTFTPPGPMGLNLQNYLQNQANADQDTPLDKNVNQFHKSIDHLQLDSLVEYPLRNKQFSVQNNVTRSVKQNSNLEVNIEVTDQTISENTSIEIESMDINPEKEIPSEPIEPIPPSIPVKFIIMNQNSKPWSPLNTRKYLKNK